MQNTPTSQQSVRSEDTEVTKNETDSRTTPESSSPALGAKPRARKEEKTRDEEPSSPAPLDVLDEDPGKELEDRKERPEAGTGNAGEDEPSPESEVEPDENEESIYKSIRIWKEAYYALKVLAGKYGTTMVDMATTAINAYAKKAAAAPVVSYRMLDPKCLFPLQASATDIKEGLSDFEKDLYKARKSHRDPVERKSLYDQLSKNYQKAFKHADETLTSIDKESVLHDLLEPSDHALLIQAIATLKAAKPKAGTETQIRDLYLKIFEILIL